MLAQALPTLSLHLPKIAGPTRTGFEHRIAWQEVEVALPKPAAKLPRLLVAVLPSAEFPTPTKVCIGCCCQGLSTYNGYAEWAEHKLRSELHFQLMDRVQPLASKVKPKFLSDVFSKDLSEQVQLRMARGRAGSREGACRECHVQMCAERHSSAWATGLLQAC